MLQWTKIVLDILFALGLFACAISEAQAHHPRQAAGVFDSSGSVAACAALGDGRVRPQQVIDEVLADGLVCMDKSKFDTAEAERKLRTYPATIGSYPDALTVFRRYIYDVHLKIPHGGLYERLLVRLCGVSEN